MLSTIPPMHSRNCLNVWMQLCNLYGRCRALASVHHSTGSIATSSWRLIFLWPLLAQRGYCKDKCMTRCFNALAGNRTRVNCLEGSYASHYTTNAYFASFLRGETALPMDSFVCVPVPSSINSCNDNWWPEEGSVSQAPHTSTVL